MPPYSLIIHWYDVICDYYVVTSWLLPKWRADVCRYKNWGRISGYTEFPHRSNYGQCVGDSCFGFIDFYLANDLKQSNKPSFLFIDSDSLLSHLTLLVPLITSPFARVTSPLKNSEICLAHYSLNCTNCV